MRLFFHWLTASIAIGIAAYLVRGVQVTIVGALIAAIVFGIINISIRPLLLLLTLPLNILTLGLLTFVINALLVLLVSYVVPGFFVSGFWAAILFSIVLGIINWLFHLWSIPKEKL